MEQHQKFKQQIKRIYRLFTTVFVLFGAIGIFVIYILYNPDVLVPKKTIQESEYADIPEEDDFDKIENGVHVRTGLVDAAGLMEVVNNCTNCHSAQLVTQNRMNEERWIATIRWMQETQNLWDLGNNEKIIVDYLVTNYPPKKKGRREVLTNIDWYELQQ